MENNTKLILLKLLHTFIWIFFNGVIFYMLWAAISNRLDTCLWVGYGLVALEGGILLLFKNVCPLTLIARNYSSSMKDNFDIYLPNWLARHTKAIYTSIMLLVVAITIYQLIRNQGHYSFSSWLHWLSLWFPRGSFSNTTSRNRLRNFYRYQRSISQLHFSSAD